MSLYYGYTFRCCPKSKLIEVAKVDSGSWIRDLKSSYPKFQEKIICPGGEISDIEECKDGSFIEYLLDSKLYSFSVNGSKLHIKNNCDLDAEEVVIDKSKDNFCVSIIRFLIVLELMDNIFMLIFLIFIWI